MVTIKIGDQEVKIRHLRQKASGWYFQPSKALFDAGFRPEPLGKDFSIAVARCETLNREWDALRQGAAPAAQSMAPGSWQWLVKQYEVSDWYPTNPRTLETQRLGIRVILDSPLTKSTPARCGRKDIRGFIAALRRDKSEEHVRKVVKVLRRILFYAVELELIKTNPAAKLGLEGGKPRRQKWRPEQVRAFVEKAIEMRRPGWALGVMLGYDTTQRLSDILRIQHGHFDGEGVTVQQGKTDKVVWCPLYPETIGLYKRTPRRATTIVYGERGTPIDRGRFNREFREIAKAIDLPADLQFRDLRRTGISEALSGGGRAEPISGHAPGSQAIRVYEVPNKDASRATMAARQKPGTPKVD